MLHKATIRIRAVTNLQSSPLRRVVAQQWRFNVPAPRMGDGPLLERRPDRELPDPPRSFWGKSLPIFFAIVALSSVAIFNYQKMSSSVVSSTLYSLRRSAKARAALGDEIYFKHSIPWISGEMNQMHGRINISFGVKGTKTSATMRFASFRPSARGMFETTEWSLELEDGTRIDLLEEDDPFKAVALTSEDVEQLQDEAKVKGFRKSSLN
ncbi:hypothetical protein MKZ38_003684 [Zalerion maritima]|uniref:Cytochrome oxidase assembly n=1 Tax=Zalerion maritima TaxID=339359 RepID=A0AAD5WRJ9_9PEZI|nr:hypothetical protein MKZ38_003684 [Zalerion maritima]